MQTVDEQLNDLVPVISSTGPAAGSTGNAGAARLAYALQQRDGSIRIRELAGYYMSVGRATVVAENGSTILRLPGAVAELRTFKKDQPWRKGTIPTK